VPLDNFSRELLMKYNEICKYTELSEDSLDGSNPIEMEISKLERMAKETFFAATFVPCHHDLGQQGSKVELVI